MRFSAHQRAYRRYKNGKGQNYTSFDIIKYPDAYIELVESYPCNNRDELREREGYWIKHLDCVNRCVAGRSKKQYDVDNKEKLAKQKAQYKLANKEKIRAQMSVKTDCPCGGRYTYANKATHMKTKKHQKYILLL
jgi:hypothetical protein